MSRRLLDPHINHWVVLHFGDSIARPLLHPTVAAPNATLRSLNLAGLGRGLAGYISVAPASARGLRSPFVRQTCAAMPWPFKRFRV